MRQRLAQPLFGPLVPSLLNRRDGGSTEPPYGTSASRYSVVGTHMRRCVETSGITDAGAATLVVVAVDHAMHMPDYETSEHRFHIPNSYHGISGDEVKTPSDIIIRKASVKIDGTWYPIPGLPMTIATADPGGWLPALAAGVSASANSKILLRYVYELPTLSGNLTVFPLFSWKHVAYGDRQQGYTKANEASALALVPTSGTSETALANVGGRFLAADMCIAKGGDGRPAILIMGDSNGYGAPGNAIQAGFTARGEWSYLDIGLDDIATSQRIAKCNMCVPGQASSGFQNRTRWQFTADAIKYIHDTYGSWPFDEVFDEMVENALGGGTLATAIIPYQQLLKTEWAKPVVKVQPLLKPSSSDQFRTTANQSTDATNTYPSGEKWVFNAACEAGGSLRTGGYIDDTFNAWSVECANPATNDRDILAVKSYVSTLAAGYNSFPDNIVVNHQPTIGAALAVVGCSGYAMVGGYTGSGPYTINSYLPNGFAGPVLTGAIVQEIPHGDTLHPSLAHHRDVLSTAVVAYKIARGWV